MEQRFYLPAVRAFEEHLKRNPNDLRAFLLRATALIELQRFREARDSLLLLLDRPERPEGYEVLLAQACEHYARSMAPGPKRDAELTRAAKLVSGHLERAPRDFQALHRRGRLSLLAGDLEGAARDLEASVRLVPGYFKGQIDLTRALLALGRREEALAAARAATRIRPRLVSPRAFQAQALAELGRQPQARAVLEELVGLPLPPSERQALERELQRYPR